ncbi:leucine-rich repeat domain-containing protein [Odoribacter lunatus]|uniref:leucine-rich repeat domain-containing protein n=1 Tax=Odoribacter lunatus TaxID=2941335 RepID=UPI00203DF53B|nr:hypothetical protein [Odoribacter lunatus]
MKKLFMLLLVAFATMCCVSCSDDDDDKDSPKEDPTDPNIVRTITLTIDVNSTVKFTLDNEEWLNYDDRDSSLISSIGRIPFPTDLSIDWGDGSITQSNSHKYDVSGKYNVIISAKNLRWFEATYEEITAIDLKKCNSLVGLSLENQNIYEIDIAGFTELRYLKIRDSRLKSLNADGCSKLSYCYLSSDSHYYNNLESLNINDCKNLKILDLYYNKLKELNIPKGSQLEKLNLAENEITTIDLSNCSLLQEVDLSDNELKELSIPKGSQLESLDLSSNEITTIDLSNGSLLQEVDLSDNELTSLDVSKNTELTELDCRRNEFDAEALNKIFTDLPVVTQGWLYIYNNPGTETCNKSIAENKGWRVY